MTGIESGHMFAEMISQKLDQIIPLVLSLSRSL